MIETDYFDYTANTTKEQELSVEDEVCYFRKLEERWEELLPKFADKGWLAIFPEIKAVIPQKLSGLKRERAELVATIRNKLVAIGKTPTDKFSRWFGREWVKVNEGQELLEIDRELSRWGRLRSISEGRVVKGRLSEDQIQEALNVPITDIASRYTKLRKVGKRFVGLCPFHKEKNPSFTIYPQTNSFYCFSCQKGGNVVNLVRLLRDCSFKEAVLYLIGGQR